MQVTNSVEEFCLTEGPYLPYDATPEEVAVFFVLLAERTLLYNGTLPSEILAKTGFEPLADTIVQANNRELSVGSTVVLWADFGFKNSPEPDLGDLQTAAAWVWG